MTANSALVTTSWFSCRMQTHSPQSEFSVTCWNQALKLLEVLNILASLGPRFGEFILSPSASLTAGGAAETDF